MRPKESFAGRSFKGMAENGFFRTTNKATNNQNDIKNWKWNKGGKRQRESFMGFFRAQRVLSVKDWWCNIYDNFIRNLCDLIFFIVCWPFFFWGQFCVPFKFSSTENLNLFVLKNAQNNLPRLKSNKYV